MNKEYIVLFSGWMLGLFSPVISEYISSGAKAKKIKKAVVKELQNLRTRLIFTSFKIECSLRKLDVKLLKLVFEEVDKCANDEELIEFKKLITKTNIKDDAELLKIVNKYNSNKVSRLGLKKIETLVLDSNILNLHLLQNTDLSKLLEIKFYIESVNQDIEAAYDFLKMTFDSSVSISNHTIINENINFRYESISKRCILTIEKINNLK